MVDTYKVDKIRVLGQHDIIYNTFRLQLDIFVNIRMLLPDFRILVFVTHNAFPISVGNFNQKHALVAVFPSPL